MNVSKGCARFSRSAIRISCPVERSPLRRGNRRLNQATKLAGEIHRHPGVHGALAVEKALRALEGEDPFVPDVGMNVKALLAGEPEADKPLRHYVVAG